MHLQFQGAADGVTGSLHRIRVGDADVLLDCGLHQGHRAEADRLNRDLPRWATSATSLVLSHAHIDHSGNIPTLVKRGFDGNVYCSPPTRDLCSVMLRDSAMIQEQDARYLNKHRQREGDRQRVDPLYGVAEVQEAMERMISVPLHRSMSVAPGVTMTLHNAGHVLGSSLVRLDLAEGGRRHRLLYTGDLGREQLPLLQSPEIVEGVETILIECTYGDRLHPDIGTMDDTLAEIVTSTVERGGRVYIPTFALERAQEVLFALERLHDARKVPRVPIYIDSPLAIAITEIYKLHPESLSPDVQARILDRDDPFSPPGLHYVSAIESSKALQAGTEPCIVIAGSGMCEGGRIVHHFTRALENPKHVVVIVGFMAQHTLGRRLVEGRRTVRVLGVERDVAARIRSVEGLSAHADRDDLVRFVKRTAARGHLKQVALVHGEDEPKQALAEALRSAGIRRVVPAVRGEQLDL